nr:helix-turn-helix domain-containing protein [uncultured Nitrososphaera sp.]
MAEDPLASDLKAFGLEDMEARVYVRLARLGKARASSLSSALKINRTTTYRILERLKQVGIVETSMSRPVSYIAVEPKKALQLLIDRRKDELKAAEGKYPSILEQFTKFYIPSEEAVGAKFSILQGSEEIHRAVTRLAKGALKKISLITSVRDLGKMYYSGAYEALATAAARGVAVQIVTEIDLAALEVVKHYEFAEIRHRAESKMKMVLKDEEEALITVAGGAEEEVVALWTYSQSFASAMQSIAANEFQSGIELGAIATALRTGRPAESFRIITDEKEYADNMMALLTSAKAEVYIGFNLYPTFSAPAVLEVLKSLADRGVKVRVLSAPSSDEADIVRKLHGAIEFRISAFQTDVQVMIADGKEMLFSNAARAQGNGNNRKSSGINIHTNLAGMVSFMHNIVADIWLDSREYILELETLQQSIVLNRCANAVRAIMQDRGVEIVVGNKIMGRSGVLHKFDIISPNTRTGGRIAVSFVAYSDPESTGTKLMESKIKLLDCEPIDLVIGMLTRQGEGDAQVAKLARAVGLHIVHAGDPDQLAELVFREIEKRY